MPIFNALGASTKPIVLQLPGLQGWYDGNDVNGNGTAVADNTLISTCIDKSGLGHHVTAVGSARPTFKAAIQNGKGILRFDGVANTLTTTVFSSSTIFTITVVSKLSNTTPGPLAIYNGSSGSNGYGYFSNTNRGILFGGHTEKDDGAVTTNYEIVTITYDGSTSLMYLNGVSQSLTNAATAPGAPTGTFAIGSQGAGNFWVGDIAEIIFRSTYLSTQYLQPEWAYLSGKWGIAVP